jgi:GNAT superfamily N-acetyltransferase
LIHRIRQFPLEQGALEIQYIEEGFGEFPRRKTAPEIIERLAGRDHLILIVLAPLPDDPGSIVPVSYKVAHEIRAHETDPKLADLVARLDGAVRFDGRKVFYQWIGGTRRDWRGQGHFRALTEEQEAWAIGNGFHEFVAKTKNRFYDMRAVLDALRFDVVKYEAQPDNRESKVYMSKQLSLETLALHRRRKAAVRARTSAGTDRSQSDSLAC